MTKTKKALIIGAGPAGLTTAYELLKHSKIHPIILEMDDTVGGISRTVNYKGNRLDVGGHRFFSKSDEILNWWQNIMPIENKETSIEITYHNTSKKVFTKPHKKQDDVFLIRNRVSRIFFLKKLFQYPLEFNTKTLKQLGFLLSLKIGFSYALSLLFPIRKEKSLEDFFINRFGKKLYTLLFKDYTEKVWGVACTEISPEWGKQRVKKLSIWRVIKHSISKSHKQTSFEDKNVDTSLIEKFLYPKYGPGQLWEKVANIIKDKGGEIHLNHKVLGIGNTSYMVHKVVAENMEKTTVEFNADYVISTMPVKYLVRALGSTVPHKIKTIANALQYRDFITVGLLVNSINLDDGNIKDNWIYIQENQVKLGRLQIFNNWSPYMVNDPTKIWLGLEYFCNKNDKLWNMSDEDFIQFAIKEISSLGIIDVNHVLDSTIIKMPKTYPAYFGAYNEFYKVKDYVNKFKNLYLIGRNGMHKYNNQDHSMLTAITAVQNIIHNKTDKNNIWDINTEEVYHEKK